MFTLTSAYNPASSMRCVVRSNSVVGYALTREGFHLKDRRFDDLCAAVKIARTGTDMKIGAKLNGAQCERMYKKVAKLLQDNPEWGIDDMKRPLPRRQLLHAFACFCREAADCGGLAVTWKKGWD